MTLPDFVAEPVVILAVGINPSLHAVRAGYPFAFPRNRFWPALNASQLIDEHLEPGVAAMHVLATRYGIGFTDVIKRPSAGMKSLRAADFAAGVPALRARIERYRPRIVWFHGMVAAREFLRRSVGREVAPTWGLQAGQVAGARCFVSPNPSPANASFRLADLVASYDALAACRAGLTAAGEMP